MSNSLTTARHLAQQLTAERVDVNEVEKILAYARRVRDVGKVRQMIRRLAVQDVIVYSKQTKRYAQAIRRVVEPALPDDPGAALHLLGWTTRLMHYERARAGSQRGRRRQRR
ncbi:MAG: hypothetical protein DRI79_02265 [Chloroflexi bacterium]|nr:MAG: hypothetical protein DRI79_02265 [Chloroflexota bacterium]